jgi:predicted O-methyltransferase YrrM
MFEWLKFKFAMIFGVPYFGPIMAAKMGRVVRHGYMQKLVELECKRKSFVVPLTSGTPQDDLEYHEYSVLEIGSWAGGSTITFAEAIKKYNGGRGKVVAVDAWQSFHWTNSASWRIEKPSHMIMEKALKEGKIFDLFLHNIKSAGVENLVEIKRGWSKDILPTLQTESFDLIFIDGSHFYKDVLLDLQNSTLLLKNWGVICGDDLELQFNEVDQEKLIEYKDNDTFLDPKSGAKFHPGVTLATHEFFGEPVTVWKGFWAMRKVNGGWEKINYKELNEGKIQIPKHLW